MFYILSAFSVWYSIDSCIVTIIGAFYHIFNFLLLLAALYNLVLKEALFGLVYCISREFAAVLVPRALS